VRLALVVGARPNFMKMAPILREAREVAGMEVIFVHTGQHYDDEMSKVFLDDLGLPEPDVHLGAGSGSQAQQTARILIASEEFTMNRAKT
jgi:UDP-N-acetylglucosamine 2-epimerase (non-hydrolysing)